MREVLSLHDSFNDERTFGRGFTTQLKGVYQQCPKGQMGWVMESEDKVGDGEQ